VPSSADPVKGVRLTYDGDWRLSRARSRLVTRAVDGAIICRSALEDEGVTGRMSVKAPINPNPVVLRRDVMTLP